MRNSGSLALLASDFERFKGELPRDFPAHVRAVYGIDLTARYLGETIPHPIGKGSGQLSLNESQLGVDADAGLAFARTRSLNADPAVMAALAERIIAADRSAARR